MLKLRRKNRKTDLQVNNLSNMKLEQRRERNTIEHEPLCIKLADAPSREYEQVTFGRWLCVKNEILWALTPNSQPLIPLLSFDTNRQWVINLDSNSEKQLSLRDIQILLFSLEKSLIC